MANKVIFVAFAMEDVTIRDFIKGQSLHTDTPFEYVDMSVKEAYDEEWKKRVRTRILRSDGVLVIVSKDSLTSTGQKWEIKCAKEEKKKIRGIWAYKTDRTNIDGVNTMMWTWDNITDWIDSL
jgi:Thoeris protein ThsB, TIR-like domain